MRSTVTVKQLISDVRMYAGSEETSNIPDSQILTTYNLCNQKIYQLLNGSKSGKFKFHSPVGTPAGYLSFEGTLTYTAATKKISGTMTIDSTYIGALVMYGHTTYRLTHITAVTTNTDFTVASGGGIDVAQIYAIILKPPSGSSHTLSNHRLDRIHRVHFTNSGDSPIKNEDEIEASSVNSNLINDVAVCVTGTGGSTVLKCVAGSSTVNSGGFPVIFGEELPYWSTSVNDYVDLPLEFHSTLFEDISRGTLIERGIEIPKALESSENVIEAISQTYQMAHDTIVNSRDK